MTTATLNNLKRLNFFVIKNEVKNTKSLLDFKKYIVKSWKTEKENISENIDNILYK